MDKPNYVLPYIDYVNSDKSMYPFVSTVIDPRTKECYIDADNDFRLGKSGGFLMDISFTFINTHLMNEAARNYEVNIKNQEYVSWVESLSIPDTEARNKYYYCNELKGTAGYDNFWRTETERRRNGLVVPCKLLPNGEVTDLHITGDLYNYLNYGRIQRTPTAEEVAKLHAKGDFKTKLITGFPRFWDGDYWNFKIDFFIASNGFHLAKAKARGKGYSNKRGNQAANSANLIQAATIILAAYDLKYLTTQSATSDMVKTNLDWFEENTHWKRFYLSEQLSNIELGYKTKKGGNKKFGVRSKVLSVSLFNNASAAIGKRALEIDVEESGKCPNLDDFMDVTLSSTEVGASNVGTIRCYGTAGVDGHDWRPFSRIFYNPRKYKMMPFENIWDDNARHGVCGFFHPQILNMEPFIDKDGNSLLYEAQLYDVIDKENQAKELTVDKWLMYVGQRANKPSEAFKSATSNLFSSPGLSAHVAKIQSDPESISYRDGMVFEINKRIVFKTNKQLINEGLGAYAHPYIEDVPFNPTKDIYGCIREFHPPYKIDGKIPDKLYTIVYDCVGKDKKSDLVIGANSLNAVVVYMNPNLVANSIGKIPVAFYAGRPETMEEADRIVAYLCDYYNADVLAEIDRGTIVTNFKKWHMHHRLVDDPTAIINSKGAEPGHVGKGINMGSGQNSTESLLYFKEMLYTKMSVDENGEVLYLYHYYKDLPSLLELENFNVEGNFDRVSAMKLYPYIIKVRTIKQVIITNTNRDVSIHEQIGLYGFKN